jgi:AbrB family looped-hinge helix DNA binding protein
MNALTVTAKGQITLRKDILRHLGIKPGDKVVVHELPNGRLELAADRRTGKISDVFGCFKREGGPHLTIEEMNDIIERGWAGEFEDNG